MYYLKDHERVEYYNASRVTPESKGEARKKEKINDSNRITTTGDAITVLRARPPLGLLSVRMREYREKEKSRINGFATGDISKEGRVASPGVLSVPFLHILLTLRRRAISSCREGARTTVRF